MANRLNVEPLTPYCGAEISGVPVNELTDAELQIVKAEVVNRCVAILPGQFVSPKDQVAFAQRLGDVQIPGHHPTLEGAKGIFQLQSQHSYENAAYRTNFWHTDATHMPQPPSYTLISCVQPAPLGGDTMWANQYRAYETLSETMKAMIRGRRIGFKIHEAYAPFRNPDEPVETFHPLVRVHAETGRKSLYLSDDRTCTKIEGLADDESKTLYRFLYQHSHVPEHTYRHRWRKGDLAIWDNRCSLHYAMLDYDATVTRTMNRVMVSGEVPIADIDGAEPKRMLAS